MREVIKSAQNKQIKHIKSLHNKKFRDDADQFIIEGYKLIEEALECKRDLSMFLITESAADDTHTQNLLQKLQDEECMIIVAEDRVFKEASEMDAPQGVLAVLNKQEHDIEEVLNQPKFNIVILDEVRDPGNVGTIIRTADACGISAVVLSKNCVDLYNGKTIRATMGSLFHLPVITEAEIINLISRLKDSGAVVLGADPYGSISCIDADYSSRTAIVIGNEAKGMRAEVKAATTINIKIPMPGKAESLNAGIAAAILMYELAVRKTR